MANNIAQEPNDLIIIIEESCNIELVISDSNIIKDIIVTEESKTNVIIEQQQSFEIFPVAAPVALQGERGYSGYSGYSGQSIRGTSGYSGVPGPAGPVGISGISGYSGSGTNDHSLLQNLDYESSGHSGFQKAMTWDEDFKAYLIDRP